MTDRTIRETESTSVTPRRRSRALILLSSLVLGACAAPPSAVYYREAVEAFRAANFRAAYRASQKALAETPDDPKIQGFAERMRAAILLDEARSRIFDGREREGLKLLARVRTFHAGNKTAELWERKAKDQLALRLQTAGQEALADSDPESALESFQEVLTLQPGNEVALRGLKDVQEIFDERSANASAHYRDAMRARQLPDWEQALYHAAATTATDPTHLRAQRIEVSARRQVATRRERWADKLAAEGRWGAAGRELLEVARMLRGLDADGADEATARAKTYANEAEAQQCYSNAEFKIASKDFDKAREELAHADKLSTLDRVTLNELQGMLASAERDARYAEAQFLELSYQIESALGLYSDLAKADPGGIAEAKVESLSNLLKEVVAAYEKGRAAEGAGEAAEAISAYRRVLSLYPLYKDANARLKALIEAAKKAAAATKQAPDGDDGSR